MRKEALQDENLPTNYCYREAGSSLRSTFGKINKFKELKEFKEIFASAVHDFLRRSDLRQSFEKADDSKFPSIKSVL